MTQNKIPFLLLLTVTAAISSCSSDNPPAASPGPQSTSTPTAGLTPSPSPTSSVTAATFTQVNQTVLQPSCISCHSGTASSGGVDLSSYSSVLNQVQPGSPDSSRLYQVIVSGQMPPSGALPSNQVQLVHDWIAAGAHND